MNKRSANLSIVAARAALNTVPVRLPDLPAVITGYDNHSRRHKARMTGAQRDSAGRYSDWNKSPYVWTDPAWGRTVSTVNA